MPEWRKEGLGQEMLEALEAIERDRPPSAAAGGRRRSESGSRRWSLIPGRFSSGSSKSKLSSKEVRKAEKRRAEAEASAPAAPSLDISAPFAVNHSLFLEDSPRVSEGVRMTF